MCGQAQNTCGMKVHSDINAKDKKNAYTVSVFCYSGVGHFQEKGNGNLNYSLNLAGMFPSGVIMKKKVVKDVKHVKRAEKMENRKH